MTALALTAAVALAAPAPQPPDGERVVMDASTQEAVRKALGHLQRSQQRDGSWGNSAVTGFALLAFLSNGHLPNQGPFGATVDRGVRHLLACGAGRADGYLVGPRDGNMYSHGMATLALSQVYGMGGDDELRQTLKRAVDLIIRSQNSAGGWRYEPAPTDADISVTIMQVMALRGAKDSGLHVPDQTMRKAIAYIHRCYDRNSGGYKYQPQSSGAGFARTAAGVCVLQLSGEYQAEEIGRAVRYLQRQGDDGGYFWYGHYYAAHAFHQVGGQAWADYYARLRGRLLAVQKKDGRWEEPQEGNVGPNYQTAIAVIILSVPTDYLPIFQR
jgi:hypothetical protein